jgi:type II secretory pathway component PulM
VGTGWQLLQGIAALFVSVALTYWIFVSPSRAKRERQRLARELQDPRRP